MQKNIDQQNEPILKIQDLSVSFVQDDRIKHVILNLNFNLYSGKITALVGETGAGKTITGMALMGLLNAKTAIVKGAYDYISSIKTPKILLSDFDMNRGSDIAMIFQDPLSAFSPVRKIKYQIDDIVKLTNSSKVKDHYSTLEDMMLELELKDTKRLLNSYPHQVSGGELQRLMVAMTLLQNPKILIADEPAASLDDSAKIKLYNLLSRLCIKYNMAILLITHDISKLTYVASELLVLNEGQIIESGHTNDILIRPHCSYTKKLIGATPSSAHKVERLGESNDDYQLVSGLIDEKKHNSYLEGLCKRETMLELKHIYIRYLSTNWRTKTDKKNLISALNNISFKLKKGECLGIVGDSGSGKSSLLSAIVRLVDYEGEILFQKKDIRHIKAELNQNFKRKVQLIFQNSSSSLNPSMTVLKTLKLELKVLYPSQNKKFYIRKIKKLLLDVQFRWDDVDKYPHELSGGQQQRVCIARALAFDPILLLCDEIVSALDMTVQAKILNLLKDLKDKYNLSIIFISHDMGVIRFIGDRVLKLDKGNCVFYGSVLEM